MQRFELEQGGGALRLAGSSSGMSSGPGLCRRRGSPLCASITANAAHLVLPAAAAAAAAPGSVVALASDAQHGLLSAAAFFVAHGSAAPLRRHHRRSKPIVKRVAPSGGRAPPPPASVSLATAAVSSTESSATAAAASAAVQQLRGVQQFLAGGIAGAVSKTLVAPLERVSTMLMADGGRLSVGQATRHAWQTGLFRGNTATVLKIFPASAIQFAVFHGLKDRILTARRQQRQHQHQRVGDSSRAGGTAAAAAAVAPPGSSSSSSPPAQPPAATAAATPAGDELANHERLLAGAAAGAASVAVTYPLESMRTMMSVAGGVRGSLLEAGRSIVASQGLAALYRGFKATLIGDMMGNALGFTFYEIGNRIYRDMNGGTAAPPHLRGVIGACSAACVMTLTMPLEVVRRRLQVQGLAGRPVLYRGTLDCLRQVLRKEGLRGFYAASIPSYLKVAPSIGCMYFLYELLTNSMTATFPAPAPASITAAPAATVPERK